MNDEDGAQPHDMLNPAFSPCLQLFDFLPDIHILSPPSLEPIRITFDGLALNIGTTPMAKNSDPTMPMHAEASWINEAADMKQSNEDREFVRSTYQNLTWIAAQVPTRR